MSDATPVSAPVPTGDPVSTENPPAPSLSFDDVILPAGAPGIDDPSTPAQVVAAVDSNTPAPTGTIWSAAFWKGAGERAVKTFFQTGLAYVGVSAIIVTDVNWETVAEAGALGAILSLATSIGNAGFTAGK